MTVRDCRNFRRGADPPDTLSEIGPVTSDPVGDDLVIEDGEHARILGRAQRAGIDPHRVLVALGLDPARYSHLMRAARR